MKTIVKRMALVAMAAALTLSVAGCGLLGDNMIKDAQTYIQGQLDVLYKGQFNPEYLELIDTTEEEASEEYESWVDVEAQNFCDYFSVYYPTETYMEQVKDLYREVYAMAKYTVKSTSKLDSGAYAVEVEAEPMVLMPLVTTDDQMALWDDACEGKDSAEMSEEEFEAADVRYADQVLAAVRAQIPNISYNSAEPFVFQMKEDTDGYYVMVVSDLATFDEYILVY